MLKVVRVTFNSESMPMGPNHDPVSYLADRQTIDGYKYTMAFDETNTWLKVQGESLKGGNPHIQWIPFMQIKAADFVDVEDRMQKLVDASEEAGLYKQEQTEVNAPKKAKRGT
jgi:hypothetical protein